MTNPNDPAFVRRQVPKNPPKKDDAVYEHGLTKREYFAAMAIQGLASDMSNIITALKAHGNSAEGIAVVAVVYADALIKELSK